MKKNPSRKKRRRYYKATPTVKHKKKKFVWLNILPDGIWLKVRRGINLWKAMQRTNVALEGECDGLGKCGKCKIMVVTAIGPPDEDEKKALSDEDLETGVRLACRIRLEKDLVVHSMIEDQPGDFYQILKHGQVPPIRIDPLIYKMDVTIRESGGSDSHFLRLRKALGRDFKNMEITHRCLAALNKNLRKTRFDGLAIFHDRRMLAWEPRWSVNGRFGIIFDLGTTTLVGKLIELSEGCEVAVISRLNSQTKYGTDVISRIQYVTEHSNGLLRMRDLLIKDLNFISQQLVATIGLSLNNIFSAVAAGNTTMQHFLLGLDPSGIAEAPFTPVITEGLAYGTKHLGLMFHPDAMIYVMPGKSGYIGSDLIGFIMASGAGESETMSLGLDIGTNGEIFLGNKCRMLTCSAAAGPALEGARITHGMMAKRGAIESFRMGDNGLSYNVIGNIKPMAMCGSGLVDLVALLLHNGLVDAEGLINPLGEEPGNGLASRFVKDRGTGTYKFLVASAEESFHKKEIYLTQKDVRELQLAKAAISAGIKVLMKETGVAANELDTIFLAGALGNYVNPYSAQRIGLIPKTDVSKNKSLGNAASIGAQMALLSKGQWKKSIAIADFIEHVELSEHPDFFEYFIEEMNFPKENMW